MAISVTSPARDERRAGHGFALLDRASPAKFERKEVVNIGRIVADITPPELVAVRDRMTAIKAESEAIQHERDPIERCLDGGRNLTVDVRERLKGKTADLARRSAALLDERLQLQRQVDTLQPQLATSLTAALAPTLAEAADRVADLVEQLEGALAECGEMVEALRTAGAAVPEITRPRLLEVTRADALKLMEI
jgi:hypothetical protein